LRCIGVGLALFVEGHHHGGRAVPAQQPGLLAKGVFALLHADRVDDGLALHAAQAGLDHAPLRRVDHDRHPRDVGLAGDQVQETHHGGLAVEHGLVHVDVDDLRAVLDLLACHGQCLFEFAIQDHPRERLGAGDVGALADVDEQRVCADGDWLQAGQAHRLDHRLWWCGGLGGGHGSPFVDCAACVIGTPRGGGWNERRCCTQAWRGHRIPAGWSRCNAPWAAGF
jgi:hypothetical protein